MRTSYIAKVLNHYRESLKTVNVEESTWKALSRLKLDWELDSLDSVITKLLEIGVKSSMEKAIKR